MRPPPRTRLRAATSTSDVERLKRMGPDPMAMGYDAMLAGEPRAANRYRAGTEAHGEWDAGWVEGFNEKGFLWPVVPIK